MKKKLRFVWPLVLLVAVIALLQWPALKELYYQSTVAEERESTIVWRHDYQQALAEAQQTGRPLLVVFSATWCPPCKVMKREVWPDAQVSELVEAGYIPLHVDVDEQSQSPVVSRYQVRSIPSIFVVGKDEQVMREGKSMSRTQLLRFLGNHEV
jgi:thioredoxin 1